ncbi:MAG: hypothetical protein KGI57_03455 [Hyphomicrobiales bacterium]|nr:hypothetical protein [Hyphomicrobiales bacterium]
MRRSSRNGATAGACAIVATDGARQHARAMPTPAPSILQRASWRQSDIGATTGARSAVIIRIEARAPRAAAGDEPTLTAMTTAINAKTRRWSQIRAMPLS